MRALDLVARCSSMTQIVALCLVHHGGRCFGSDRSKVGATPRYKTVGTDGSVPLALTGDRNRSRGPSYAAFFAGSSPIWRWLPAHGRNGVER
jgi:hypothetical protein